MVYFKLVDGNKVYASNPIFVGEVAIYNPTDEILLANGYEVETEIEEI